MLKLICIFALITIPSWGWKRNLKLKKHGKYRSNRSRGNSYR